MDNNRFEFVNDIKSPGAYFSKDPTWECHINHMLPEINIINAIMNKPRPILQNKTVKY